MLLPTKKHNYVGDSFSNNQHKNSFVEPSQLYKSTSCDESLFQRRIFRLDKLYKPRGLEKRSIEDIAHERKQGSKLYLRKLEQPSILPEFSISNADDREERSPPVKQKTEQISSRGRKDILVNSILALDMDEIKKNYEKIRQSQFYCDKQQKTYDYMAFGLTNSNKNAKQIDQILRTRDINSIKSQQSHKQMKSQLKRMKNMFTANHKDPIQDRKKHTSGSPKKKFIEMERVQQKFKEDQMYNQYIAKNFKETEESLKKQRTLKGALKKNKKRNKIVLDPIKNDSGCSKNGSIERKQKQLKQKPMNNNSMVGRTVLFDIPLNQNIQHLQKRQKCFQSQNCAKKTLAQPNFQPIQISLRNQKKSLYKTESNQITPLGSESPSHLNSRYDIN